MIQTEGLEDTVISPFAPPVYITRVSNDILSILASAGELAKEESQTINDALAGEIKHEYNLNFKEEDIDVFNNFVLEKTKEFYLKTPITPKHNSVLASASIGQPWINYSYAGDFNPLHIHHASLSYIIYVDIPENIRNDYKNSYSQTKGILQLTYNNAQIHLSPKTGDMILFPSNVFHCVYPFTEQGCRISVAGNIHNVQLETN
jgi:predicted 2-oxoglutarate/Fe(II)-dependent dioxygenase YbiX|tara:strand:+ start:84 stop:695 length:612 start_codon:yes stop_codon:yes gene_type:complete